MNKEAYHGTALKHLSNIKEYGLDPKYSQDRKDHWLGQGVYFFNDYKKARWWANSISKKNNNCGAIVLKSEIFAPDTEVLNLDNQDELDKIMDFFHELNDNIKKECRGNMPIFDMDTARAVLFDYYKQEHNISVIIGTFPKTHAGYTKERNKEELRNQEKILDIIGIYFYEQQICVSKKECIQSTTLVYNEKEEVI